jgi:hypothetical protein
VFGQAAFLDPDHVRGNPGDGPAIAREAAMDDVIPFREDELMLVAQASGALRIRLNRPSRPGSMCALCWT